ncbi:hypothetical protein BJQ93_02867 [Bacillus subtilis]|nr:hypothetical protein [Bacillus subtilis]
MNMMKCRHGVKNLEVGLSANRSIMLDVICQPITDKEKSDMIQVLGAMFRLYNFDLLVR